jgi:hypothetical protein
MPAPETPSDKAQSADDAPKTPKNDDPGYKDLAAIGIGCLIFVIFFVAIVIAGMARE